MLDRIDLHVEVGRVPTEELIGAVGDRLSERQSPLMRERVCEARALAAVRLRGTPYRTNAELTPRLLRQVCELDRSGVALLRAAEERHGFTARACHRVLKVARTIADLAGEERLTPEHVGEAIMYRVLDRGGGG